VISVGPFDAAPAAGENPVSSTDSVHRANPLGERRDGVFPVVHTPYDYDERFLR
jgi:hypothetical protein